MIYNSLQLISFIVYTDLLLFSIYCMMDPNRIKKARFWPIIKMYQSMLPARGDIIITALTHF